MTKVFDKMKYKPSNIINIPCGNPLDASFPLILLLAKIASMSVRSVCLLVSLSVRHSLCGHSLSVIKFKFLQKVCIVPHTYPIEGIDNPDFVLDTGIFFLFL